MSKRGKILGTIAYILFFGSIAIMIVGRSFNAFTIGLIGIVISIFYIMILKMIAQVNKAKLERQAMEDIHKIAEQLDNKES